jgi:hypothetical protein
VITQHLYAAKGLVAAVAVDPYFFYIVGRGQVKRRFVDHGFMVEQESGFVAEKVKCFF